MSNEHKFVSDDVIGTFAHIMDKVMNGPSERDREELEGKVAKVQALCLKLSGGDPVKTVSLCMGSAISMIKGSHGLRFRPMDLKGLQEIAQDTVCDMNCLQSGILLSQCNQVFAPVEGSDGSSDDSSDGSLDGSSDDGSSESDGKGRKRGAKESSGGGAAKKRRQIRGSDDETENGSSTDVASLRKQIDTLETRLYEQRNEIREHLDNNEALRKTILEMDLLSRKKDLFLLMANEGAAASTPGRPAVFTVDNFCAVYNCVINDPDIKTADKSAFKARILGCHEMCRDMKEFFKTISWDAATDKTSAPKLRDEIVTAFRPIYKDFQTTAAFMTLHEKHRKSLSETMAPGSVFKRDNLYRMVFLLEATMCLGDLTKKGNGSKKDGKSKKGKASKKGSKSRDDDEPQKKTKLVADARKVLEKAEDEYRAFREGKDSKKDAGNVDKPDKGGAAVNAGGKGQ
jgi:hypothetical protein